MEPVSKIRKWDEISEEEEENSSEILEKRARVEFVAEKVDRDIRFVFGELLTQILKNLRTPDLFHHTRLVCKSWRDESTSILLQRKSLKTSFKYNPEKQHFLLTQRKQSNEEDSEQTLRKLSKLLKSHPYPHSLNNFPSCSFRFESGNLNCSETLEFFKVYGGKVRNLTVDIRLNCPSKNGTLRKKIFNLTPFLESLQFYDSEPHKPWTWIDETNYNYNKQKDDKNEEENTNTSTNKNKKKSNPQLSHLKFLKFGWSIRKGQRFLSVYEEIRPLSPQLKTVEISSLEVDEVNPSLRLLSLSFGIKLNIRETKLQFFRPNSCPPEAIQKAAEANLQFQNLKLFGSLEQPTLDYLKRSRSSFWRILQNTRDTLKEIDNCTIECFNLLSLCPLTPGFFTNLKTLSLSFFNFEHGLAQHQNINVSSFFHRENSNENPNQDYDDDEDFPVAPLWRNLSDVAPGLQKIYLRLFDGDCESWLPFLDSQSGPNSSVKELILSNLWELSTLKKLTASFPSLETLNVSGIQRFSSTRKISTVEDLVSLVFSIEKNKSNNENPLNVLNLRRLNMLAMSFVTCPGQLASTSKKKTGEKYSKCVLFDMTGPHNYVFNPKKNVYLKSRSFDLLFGKDI